MKNCIVLFLLLVIPLTGMAQAPDTLWTRAIGGNNDDEGRSVQQTTDGGYILAGSTQSFGLNDQVYLVKTDALGNPVWQHTYGGGSINKGYSVQQTADGGFVVTGNTYSFGSNGQVYLVKTDVQGNLQWQNNYGGVTSMGYGFCVRQTSDGGYIIVGETMPDLNHSDMYLVKTDSQGNLVWQQIFDFSDDDVGYSVRQTTDGGYIIAGTILIPTVAPVAYLVKTNSDGAMTWSHPIQIGVNVGEEGYDVQQTGDGGYIVTGDVTYSGPNTDAFLAKTNPLGIVEWQNHYGGLYDLEQGQSVVLTGDSGYVVTGYRGVFNPEVYLFKVDASGTLVWQTAWGGHNENYGYSLGLTADGNFIIGGTCRSFSGDYDMLMLKTTFNGPPPVSIDLVSFTQPIQIPATGGSFEYFAFLHNTGTAPAPAALWTRQILPDGSLSAPIQGPVTVTLPAGTRGWYRHQNVPAAAAPGEYRYIGYVGVNPNTVWGSDTLLYTKLSTGNGPLVSDWDNAENDLMDEAPHSALSTFSLVSVSPNPFNATTAISYQLSAISDVSLKVYDTAGRLVTTLMEGWQEAGSHEVIFDGSSLASGVYLVRIQAGNLRDVQKLVLMR